MAKKKNNDTKLDVRVVFEPPLSDILREMSQTEQRKFPQLIRFLLSQQLVK